MPAWRNRRTTRLVDEERLQGRAKARWILGSRLSANRGLSVAALAVGLVWIGLRIAYWNGYYTEDAPGYVTDAIWTSLGTFQARAYVNGMNIGTYWPVALPLSLFGKSEIALSVWPLFCSLLGLVSLGTLTGLVFGRAYGLLAAFLYATYPGDIFFSTVVMPDAIQAGWLSFSLLLVVLAHTGPPEKKRWRLAAGGVAMGICHLIRAGDVLLLPVGVSAAALFPLCLTRESPLKVVRDCLVFLSGWVLVLVVEGLCYLAISGDFFLRFNVLNRHYGTLDSIKQWGLNHDPHTIPYSLFPPSLWWKFGGWWRLTPDQAYHGLIFCWALLSLLAGLVALAVLRGEVPRRAIAGYLLALCWLGWPVTYHQFGSQSLTHFVPIHRLSRHFVVYGPGAIFATAAGCFLTAQAALKWRSANGRMLFAGTAASLLLLHLFFNWQGEQIAYGAYQRIKGTYLRIRSNLPDSVDTIVGDPGDLCFFDFWLNPLGVERVRMVAFANVSGCGQLPSGAVLTWSNPGWDGLSAAVIRETVRRLPCLMRPPPGWRLLYEGHPERVYLIEHAR